MKEINRCNLCDEILEKSHIKIKINNKKRLPSITKSAKIYHVAGRDIYICQRHSYWEWQNYFDKLNLKEKEII